MKKVSLRLLCQIYLLLLISVASVLSPLPYLLLGIVLILVVLVIALRPPTPRLSVVTIVGVIFLLPLLLEQAIHFIPYVTLQSPTLLEFVAAATILPVIYLLDWELRQNAQDMPISHNIKRRQITPILSALFVSILAIVLVSLIINNRVLLFTGVIVVFYLLVILVRVLRAILGLPVDVSAVRKRVVAGTTADISLYMTRKVSMRLHCLLSPVDSWVRIKLHRYTLDRAKKELNLTIIPPLAGPTHPQLQLSIMDPWGVIQVDKVIEPVEVNVIPRARYAERLAVRFLKQIGRGTTVASTMLPETVLMPKRGIEYFDSRTYQPGDPLKDVDWKHSIKLNELIIKRHIEAGAQTAIIAVNLSVTNAEGADKLAFNVITAALTLAHEAIPTALAAYNHEKVIATTAVADPKETLKQTLLLVKDIAEVEFAHRFLQLPDITKLRRNLNLLRQVTSQSGRRLLSMLEFEYQAMEEAAKNNPATLALSRATKHVTPPAIIVMVSQLNHDAEALLVTSEKLFKRGFTTVPIAMAESNI